MTHPIAPTDIPMCTRLWKPWLAPEATWCGHEYPYFGLLSMPHYSMCEICMNDAKATSEYARCADCGKVGEPLREFRSGTGSGGVSVNLYMRLCWACEMNNYFEMTDGWAQP